MKYCFCYVKVYTYSERVFNTLYIEIKHVLKQIPLGKMNGVKKKSSFFFRELQLITVLLLICDFYMSWSIRFVSQKLFVGFSIFDSVLFLLKFIFLFSKMHGLYDFNTSLFRRALKNWRYSLITETLPSEH